MILPEPAQISKKLLIRGKKAATDLEGFVLESNSQNRVHLSRHRSPLARGDDGVKIRMPGLC